MIKNHKVEEKHYMAVHYWLKYNYGNANQCENKECIGKSKFYNWALKKGKVYEYKRSSFFKLCRSCHAKYDMTEDSMKNYMKPVYKMKDGKIVKKYISISEASRDTGYQSGWICECLNGRKNTTHGFTWKYV